VKVKKSSGILNFLIIALGFIFIFKAILELLAILGILVPTILQDFISDIGSAAALSIFGGQGLVSIVLGLWCIIAGFGMFKEAEWAMGQALVILSIMVVMGIPSILGWITNPASFDVMYWPNYIILASFIIGVIGFIWLLATRRRYA
jgi:hypothetical protein